MIPNSEVLIKVLTGVLRVLLIPVTNWLISKNIITSDESVKFVAEVAAYVIAIGWAVWAWIKSHRAQNTALAMPEGSTPAELKAVINQGMTAAALTPADSVPVITKK